MNYLIVMLPAKGMTQLVRTVTKVQRKINRRLRVDGVLLTLADMRTNLDTIIPVSIKAVETS